MIAPPPPKLSDLLRGTQLRAGLGVSTVHADIDFETYSGAGFVWNNETNKFDCPRGAAKKGLPVVGVAVYSQHITAEVLSCAYDLKDGKGKRLWTPDMPPPMDLLGYVASGGILEAWNSAFEWWVWNYVCTWKYKWPALKLEQMRCAMSKARAHALPGHLADAGSVLKIEHQKDKDGRRLLEKFSWPRNPTKHNPNWRIFPKDDPIDAKRLYQYNLRDIEAEAEISSLIPDLSPSELEFWLCDQRINARGVRMDVASIHACMEVIDQAHLKYNGQLHHITNGWVSSATEVAKFKAWLAAQKIFVDSLDADSIEELLKQDHPAPVRRALEIRGLIASAAVAKLFTMNNQISRDSRLHELFAYHSARTGRAAGRGVQPQNLPNSGLEVLLCSGCQKHFKAPTPCCPWCGDAWSKAVEWNPKAVEDALEVVSTKSLDAVEYYFQDAIGVISGCIRGMFIASPGCDLICSDYSAIEAVVLAAMAGEEWRMEVFRTHGKIYEMSASTITGIPFDEFLLYKSTTGNHHPARKTHGKVAELASGYGGWIGAWKAFGADEFFHDHEIKQMILAWRAASPAIVEFWGGQMRGWDTPEYYGLEGAAIQAVMMPGNWFKYRDVAYIVNQGVLYCQLPSGRFITYHKPELRPSERRPGTFALSFEGWNTNPKYGRVGWVRIDTYSGKLCENVIQAVSRDILAHAIVNLEKAGYPVVLHVHDEIVCDVREGFGSVEEFEKIMSTLPTWAAGWPVKASGGWRAKRYAK